MKGFITNLRAYNDGFIIGKWLDFPVTDAALEEAKNISAAKIPRNGL